MSNAVRIALVAEGITDFVFLRAAIESMLDGRPFDLKLLQPEGSVAFVSAGQAGIFGGGWKGVYRWCLQTADRTGGMLADDVLFLSYDLLIVHLDADVAGENPAADSSYPIPELAGILPCERPCPPPSASTDPLRAIMLAWLGESQIPPQTVFCTPSKSTEAWMMALFFPTDGLMTRDGFECFPAPADRLQQQPLAVRFSKSRAEFEKRYGQIVAAWPAVADRLREANRFRTEFLAGIPI